MTVLGLVDNWPRLYRTLLNSSSRGHELPLTAAWRGYRKPEEFVIKQDSSMMTFVWLYTGMSFKYGPKWATFVVLLNAS